MSRVPLSGSCRHVPAMLVTRLYAARSSASDAAEFQISFLRRLRGRRAANARNVRLAHSRTRRGSVARRSFLRRQEILIAEIGLRRPSDDNVGSICSLMAGIASCGQPIEPARQKILPLVRLIGNRRVPSCGLPRRARAWRDRPESCP